MKLLSPPSLLVFTTKLIKPGFHMSRKSQTIGDFTFCRTSRILPIYQPASQALGSSGRKRERARARETRKGFLSPRVSPSRPPFFSCAHYFQAPATQATDISDNRQKSVPIWGTGAQQFRGLVMSEIHRRRLRGQRFEFSFVGNDHRPSQKSGTRRENRNAPDSPDLSPSIPDDRGYLRFRVFISRQNLGQFGNSKISDRLGFSRHMKTGFYDRLYHDCNTSFFPADPGWFIHVLEFWIRFLIFRSVTTHSIFMCLSFSTLCSCFYFFIIYYYLL